MNWLHLSLRGSVAQRVLPRQGCLRSIHFHQGHHHHWYHSSSMAQQQPKSLLNLSQCRFHHHRRLRYHITAATTASKMVYKWIITNPRCQLKCPRSMLVLRHHPHHSVKRALLSMMPVDLRIPETRPNLPLRCLLILYLERSLLLLLRFTLLAA